VEALLGRVGRLEAEVTALRSTTETVTAPTLTQLQIDLQKLKDATALLTLALPPSPSGWNSVIVPDFPVLFEEFRQKKFTLLWRGSRDGFGTTTFHKRCDGHANTLTVILDTDGNIFGGFTPLEWGCNSYEKADPSLKSFLFTLKNPHNVPARRFALKAEEKNYAAIYCHSNYGSCFGIDIFVLDDCNANTDSSTRLGDHYINDTGRNGDKFFTGSRKFQVKEIEVFEITA
jgi:hypothetical protein